MCCWPTRGAPLRVSRPQRSHPPLPGAGPRPPSPGQGAPPSSSLPGVPLTRRPSPLYSVTTAQIPLTTFLSNSSILSLRSSNRRLSIVERGAHNPDLISSRIYFTFTYPRGLFPLNSKHCSHSILEILNPKLLTLVSNLLL